MVSFPYNKILPINETRGYILYLAWKTTLHQVLQITSSTYLGQIFVLVITLVVGNCLRNTHSLNLLAYVSNAGLYNDTQAEISQVCE